MSGRITGCLVYPCMAMSLSDIWKELAKSQRCWKHGLVNLSGASNISKVWSLNAVALPGLYFSKRCLQIKLLLTSWSVCITMRPGSTVQLAMMAWNACKQVSELGIVLIALQPYNSRTTGHWIFGLLAVMKMVCFQVTSVACQKLLNAESED